MLRPLTWRDIPVLAALEPELFAADAWSEASWWSELAQRPRRSYVVAEQDGAVAGYAGIDRAGEIADVMTIAVAPDGAGAGLGPPADGPPGVGRPRQRRRLPHARGAGGQRPGPAPL